MAINASVGNTGESDQEMGINGHAVALLQPLPVARAGGPAITSGVCAASLSQTYRPLTYRPLTGQPGGRNGLGLI